MPENQYDIDSKSLITYERAGAEQWGAKVKVIRADQIDYEGRYQQRSAHGYHLPTNLE